MILDGNFDNQKSTNHILFRIFFFLKISQLFNIYLQTKEY